jgi:hypothetical protein
MAEEKVELQMRVTEHNGRRMWSFVMEGRELYEILCSHVAWTMIRTSGKSIKEVENMTVSCIDNSNEKSLEELAAIKNPFIRAILTEKKRLGLKEIYTEDKHER